MLPTLKPGQDVLVFKWAYLFSAPKVGNIVAIKVNGKEMVKRVHKCRDRLSYVMGDNEKMSTDSRKFGWVNEKDIIGKVIWF